MRFFVLLACVMVWPSLALAACGERVTVTTHGATHGPTHGPTQTPYSLALPAEGVALHGAVVLLAGADGHLKLDDQGCPRALRGNYLVRSAGLFRDAGYASALVDVPSDHQGPDGLAGFRNKETHARDLERVIADVRSRVKGPVWVVGTSRGSISAANVASRAAGGAAPDGVVLSSALMWGSTSRKPWTVQTVFDLPLSALKVPAFVIGHANDKCQRSPPGEMPRLLQALGSARKQMIRVEAAASTRDEAGNAACEGRSPHGFLGQEREVVGAIVRFMQAN